MCVLAGCDFLPSIPGIGISKAYSLVSKYRNLDRVSILNFLDWYSAVDIIFPYIESMYVKEFRILNNALLDIHEHFLDCIS